jgi:hypothetical protein
LLFPNYLKYAKGKILTLHFPNLPEMLSFAGMRDKGRKVVLSRGLWSLRIKHKLNI